jgi:cytochrome c peroxidase
LYTIAATRDVGLNDGVGGHHRFNAPSLRGIAWSAPYLHDGRTATLAELLKIHFPPRTEPLSADERDDLIAFLESL